MKKSGIVMTFGVFDLIHDGHRHLFTDARKLGTELVVVLATDSIVNALKGNFPVNSFLQRAKNLKREALADIIIPGDEILDSWTAVTKYNPDTIVLGYDQTKLAKSLEKFIKKNLLSTKIIKIKPYKGKILHSSVIKVKM